MTKYMARLDDNLLNTARTVFGDGLILRAWVTTWRIDGMSELEDIEKRYYSSDNDNQLDLDAKDIILEFSNGRKVLFTNSEWGSAEQIEDDDFDEI